MPIKDFSEGELSCDSTLITHVVEVNDHRSLFDVFPTIRGQDDSSGYYANLPYKNVSM